MKTMPLCISLVCLIFIVGTSLARACSCAPAINQPTTASEISKGYNAVIGEATGQTLVRKNGSVQIMTRFKVLDALGGTLSGEINVYDLSSFTSCSSEFYTGMRTELLLNNDEQGDLISPVCPSTIFTVVADFQMSGRDYPIASYNDCYPFDGNPNSSLRLSSRSECRFYGYESETPSPELKRLQERIEATELKKAQVSISPDTSAQTALSLDRSRYEYVSEMAQDFYILLGHMMRADRLPSGDIQTEYAVIDDLGQFLPDTLTFVETAKEPAFARNDLILIRREAPFRYVRYDRDDYPSIVAFADWRKHQIDRPINIKSCYSSCEDDQFRTYKVRNALYGTLDVDQAEYAMRQLEGR